MVAYTLLALTSKQVSSLLWISAALVVLVVAAGIAFMVFRRLFGPGKTYNNNGAAFTLAQLRQMKAQGQISADEFEELKAQIIQESQQ